MSLKELSKPGSDVCLCGSRWLKAAVQEVSGADGGGKEDADADADDDARREVLSRRNCAASLYIYFFSKARKEAGCEPLFSVCAVVKWRRRRRAVGVHAVPFSSSTEAIYRRQNCVL